MQMKTLLLSAAMFLAAAACFADTENRAADDTDAVAQATSQFYASLNAMFTGDVGPMLEVWSHADDVTYMGPDGEFHVGWRDVREVWEAQAALQLGGQIEPYQTRITVGTDLAFSQCYEKGSNLDPQGRPVQVSIRATNLFRKENGQWKMIGHHTDILPFLVEPQHAAPTE